MRLQAHSSSLSTPFSLMQLAMMMAEATTRLLPERSIDSTGSSPFNCLIGSGWPSRLQGTHKCQRALTMHSSTLTSRKVATTAAYSRAVSPLFSLRPSLRYLAPSALMLFPKRLQTQVDSKRWWGWVSWGGCHRFMGWVSSFKLHRE